MQLCQSWSAILHKEEKAKRTEDAVGRIGRPLHPRVDHQQSPPLGLLRRRDLLRLEDDLAIVGVLPDMRHARRVGMTVKGAHLVVPKGSKIVSGQVAMIYVSRQHGVIDC